MQFPPNSSQHSEKNLSKPCEASCLEAVNIMRNLCLSLSQPQALTSSTNLLSVSETISLITFIGCDACEAEFEHYCPHCGPPTIVEDSPVPAEDPHTAMKTLPPILQIVKSPIHGWGVFARQELKPNLWFGPYKGQRLSAKELKGMKDSGYSFQVLV